MIAYSNVIKSLLSSAKLEIAESIAIQPKRINIIEGAYSQHPYFGESYDLKILLDVDEETQRQRILKRPVHLHKQFFEEWIPMENRYFEEFKIKEKSEIIP